MCAPWQRLLPVLLLCAFVLALKKIADVDALLHLDMGKLFWTTKGYPATEPFCYPAAGQPFLYTSWLFAVGIYAVWNLFGYSGLSLIIAMSAVLLIWILYRDAVLSTGRDELIPSLVLFTGLMLAENRFVMRPEMILLLAFSTTVWLLGQYTFCGYRKGLWLLVPISLIWGNSHSSVILIVVPFVSFAVYLAIERFSPTHNSDKEKGFQALERLKWLGLLFVAVLLAALCNPNGIGQFQYGQMVMATAWYKQSITELMPPRVKELAVIWPVFVLSVVLTLLALRRRAIPYVLISISLLYVGLQAIRFFEFFCLMQASIIARSAALLVPNSWATRLKRPLTVGVVALLMLGAAGMKAGSVYPFRRDAISQERFGAGANLQHDHARAVAFLKQNDIRGKVFNIFEDGQSIIWHGWPELTVFIDGRGAIPIEMLDPYSKAFVEPTELQKLQQRYSFEILLIGRDLALETNPHGTKTYFHDPDWALVYFDRNSYVYVRKNGPFAGLIPRHGYKNVLANAGPAVYLEFIALNPDYARGLSEDLERVPPEERASTDHVLLGYCYYKTGNYAKAAEILGPVRNTSGLSLLYYGHALKALGRQAEAKAVYAEGVARFRTDDFAGAMQGLEESAARTKLLEQATAAMSAGNYAAARQALDEVLAVDGENIAALANLGYCELHDSRFAQAEQRFLEALKHKSDYDVALYGLGLTFARQNRREQATEYFRKYMVVQTSGPYYRKAKAYVEQGQLDR